MKDDIPQELHEYLFEVIDQARNGITISDPNQEDNPLIYVNQVFTEIFGYTKEEVLGKNCRFLQANDRDQANLQKIRDAVANKTETITVLRNYTKEGKLIYNEIKVSPIFDKKTGALKYFLGIQKDITESMVNTDMKKMQIAFEMLEQKESYSKQELKTLFHELSTYQAELLAQNEELIDKDKHLEMLNLELTTMFRDAPLALMLIDENLQIKKYNLKANDYFHFDSFNVQVKSIFKYVKAGSIEKLIGWVNAKEYENSDIEVDMVCANKTKRFKIGATKYTLDKSLLLFSLVDIQLEYEVKTDLEKKVQEQLAIALEREQYIQNQAKYATMGEMIDAIAHQWKQPLNIISMRTSYLTEMFEGDKSVDMDEVLKCKVSVMSQIEHLIDTLQQFREFLRPDKPKRVFNVKDTLQSVLTLIKDDIMKHNIDIVVDEQTPIRIEGVENECKHVMLNIINNAKDIFAQRGIKEKKITITLLQKEQKYMIRFEDNAGGIDESVLDKLFDQHTSAREGGTGVGLFMSKQIIEKNGGTTSAANLEKEGKVYGAVFEIAI
jgi:PAS domain S-box-containing protein